MKPSIVITLIALFVLFASFTFAQQEQGDVEAQLSGYYFTTVGGSSTFSMGSLQTKLGYYFADWLEVGLGPTWTITTMQTSEINFNVSPPRIEEKSVTEGDLGTTVFTQISFLTKSKTVPYFGGQYYKMSFRDDEDNGSVGVSAGVKFFFTRKTAFDLGGNYLFSLNTDAEGGVLFFSFGLSFLF